MVNSRRLPGGGADDADVEVLDEQDDVGPGVGSADADVVESAADTQGDDTSGVDGVAADAVVGVAHPGPGARAGFRQRVVDGRGGRPVRERTVRPVAGAGLDERVKRGLQCGDGCRLGAQPVLPARVRIRLIVARDRSWGGRGRDAGR
jgi:hypothetical protein